MLDFLIWFIELYECLYYQLHYMFLWSSFVFICSLSLYESSYHTSYPALPPVWIIKHKSSLIQSIYLPMLLPLLFLSFNPFLLSSSIPLFLLSYFWFVCLFSLSLPLPAHCSIAYYPMCVFSTLIPSLPPSLSHTPPILWGHALKGITFSDHLCLSPSSWTRHHERHPHLAHTHIHMLYRKCS